MTEYPHPVTGELLDSREDFLAAILEEEERLSAIYQRLRPLRSEYAERFDAAESPAPRHQTTTQEKVARCPRCGGRLDEQPRGTE